MKIVEAIVITLEPDLDGDIDAEKALREDKGKVNESVARDGRLDPLTHGVGRNERRANGLAHAIAIERNADERADQDREQSNSGDPEGPAHRDVDRATARWAEQDQVAPRQADAEEDVEHGTAETCCDGHSWVSHPL